MILSHAVDPRQRSGDSDGAAQSAVATRALGLPLKFDWSKSNA